MSFEHHARDHVIPDYAHKAINHYMGQSGKEYDYYQYLYFKMNWEHHRKIVEIAEEFKTKGFSDYTRDP